MYFGNLVAEPAGYSCNVRTGRRTAVYLFFQIVDLRFGNAVLGGAVEVVVCAVVMNRLAAEIAVFIHKPSGVVNVPFRIKAIADIFSSRVLFV